MMASLIQHNRESNVLENRLHSKDAAQKTLTTDSDLLKQFVHDQRQDAFTELVARHAGMVLGVCKRVLRDDHEAEDVFQATFLILAKKGRQIERRHPASLAAWLHRVAYRAALRTAQGKYQKGKPLVNEVQSTDLEQWLTISQQEEQLLLHEELSKLPELYREALVLCCLEGNSCEEASKQLDSTAGAVQKRVARGKQMLRLRLTRRGVGISVALVAMEATTCEAATLSSLVSLTSEVCTATVLHADKSIYSTNVGRIAQQGATTMKSLSTAAITTFALVIGAPILLLVGLAWGGTDSNGLQESPIESKAQPSPATDHAEFVAVQNGEPSDQTRPALNEKLRIILHRQKGDSIGVYLNSRSAYVNGKSISADELRTIVRELNAKNAILSAEPNVSKQSADDWKNTLRKAGVQKVALTQLKPKEGNAGKVRQILFRQKGNDLKIYLKGTQGIYINGTQISTGTLAEVIRRSGLDHAVLSSGLEVLPARVTQMQQWLESNGVKDVKKIGTAAKNLTLKEVADAAREKVTRDREAKLRAILVGQKGDQLKLYLGEKGAFINGKTISASELGTIVFASGLEHAVISAEPYLGKEKVANWEEALRKAGVKKIEQSIPMAN